VVEPSIENEESSVDSIVDQYKKKLQSERHNSVGKILTEDSAMQVIDPIKEKIEHNFSVVRSDFQQHIQELESRFLFQYKQYQECKRLAEHEKKQLEQVYHIKASCDAVSKLQGKIKSLEQDFQTEHDRLQRLYQSKQTELAAKISLERKAFEEEMFTKRSELDSEVQLIEELIAKKRLEFDQLEKAFTEEMKDKREQWEKEEALLEREYQQKRQTYEDEYGDFQNKIRKQSEEWKDKEIAFREEMLKKEADWKETLNELDSRKQAVEEEIKAFELQSKVNRDLEIKQYEQRKIEFEKELEQQRVQFESELNDRREEMMQQYLQERDQETDRVHQQQLDFKDKELAEVKAKMRVLQAELEASKSDSQYKKEEVEKELEKAKSKLDTLPELIKAEQKKTEILVQEKLESFYQLQQKDMEREFKQQLDSQVSANIELQRRAEVYQEQIKSLESKLKRSEIQMDQIVVNSLESKSQPTAATSVQSVQNTAVRPKILRASKRFK
jgi:hypothetical protein